LHLDVEDFQAIGQGVVEPGGRDGDQQARYGRKESFADVLESHQNDGPLRSTPSAVDEFENLGFRER